MALGIYDITKSYNVRLNSVWISRDLNKHADKVSRIIDCADWETIKEFFDCVDLFWGPLTIDRFSDSQNTKIKKFN